jgi:hypothetical protein
MSESTLISVNEHCLDNVIKLTRSSKVTTSEDVYDARGTKLLAKGADITPAMKERLVHHKLRKPLETSLSIVDGMTVATVMAEAKRLLEEVPALKVFMGDKQVSIFETLSQISLHPVAALLLTVAEKSREGFFRHGVLVTLVAVSLGAHQKLSHNERVMLALAGLLHDIGELYILPDYLNTTRTLKPEEWKHVAAHPRIGQIVLDELTDYPKLVIDAVAEHHERLDGSGYPRQFSGERISPAAQLLSMAETLSTIIVCNDDVLVRSCLALKCIPGEYPPNLISVFSRLRRDYAGAPFPSSSSEDQTVSKTLQVVKTFGQALAECEKISRIPSPSPVISDLLNRVKNRLAGLGQALKATGIEVCLENGYMAALTQADREIFLEIDVIGQEIGWRLRETARELYLRLSEAAPEASPTFSHLIEILDDPMNG